MGELWSSFLEDGERAAEDVAADVVAFPELVHGRWFPSECAAAWRAAAAGVVASRLRAR